MKKSFFERVGLIQAEEELPQEFIESSDLGLQSSMSEAENIPLSEGLMIPEDIYGKIQLSSGNNSIFKADEMAKKLPDSLSDEVKRQSLLGIIEVTGLNISSLMNDANERIMALKTVLQEFSSESSEIIKSSEDEIDQLSIKIKELKKMIDDRKKLQQDQESIINKELEYIISIVDFINPPDQSKI